MRPTLFTNKNNSGKIINYDNKLPFYAFLEGLLTDLGIAFSKKYSSIPTQLTAERKAQNSNSTATVAKELQSIALNQLAYSKLLEEKMQKINFKRMKGKTNFIHS